MALYDTDALAIEIGADLTPSLPDPTTVTGRTHDLTSTATANATWSSVGATPFLVNGAAVASITVVPGATVRVHSDGTHWVAIRPDSTRRIFSGTAVSNASGDAVFTFTPAFPSVPVVAQAVQTATTNVTEARVTALTTTSCTINVRQSPAVVILGISVLQVPQPLSGATVHLHALEAGQG